MKYLWMILVLSIAFIGCKESDYYKQKRLEMELTTVNSSYYLTTVVHSEHLFIIHNFGSGMIHHPDCPCLKNKETKSTEITSPSPIIIDFKSLK